MSKAWIPQRGIGLVRSNMRFFCSVFGAFCKRHKMKDLPEIARKLTVILGCFPGFSTGIPLSILPIVEAWE
jgi:hypothetical protein